MFETKYHQWYFGTSTDCDSSHSNSVADHDGELKRVNNNKLIYKPINSSSYYNCMTTTMQIKKAEYFPMS